MNRTETSKLNWNVDRQNRQNLIEWQEVIPLDSVEYPKNLDLCLMPEPLSDIVRHVSEAMQAPLEMSWAVSIAVMATAIGKRAKIKLPTHVEPSPLWTCTILPPGTRKSGVFNMLVSPLDDIEAEMQEIWRDDWLTWGAEKEIAETNIAKIKKDLLKNSSDRKALAMQLKEEKAIFELEPIKPRLYLTDTTTEALRRELHNHGSIGLLSAEGSSVIESFGRYNGSKGADMALFLSAHAGDPDKGARVSGTHCIREALCSMGITAQPDVLQTIGKDSMAKGRGLVDRIFFLIPQDPRGTRNYRNQIPLDVSILKQWSNMLRAVFDVKPVNPPVLIDVSKNASEAWIDFAQNIEDRQSPGDDLRAISGFSSKLAGAVGRIALAYHFTQKGATEQPVDMETMCQAINTGHVLIEHAKAAMKLMDEDASIVRAKHILEWIKRNNMQSVKPRDVYRAGAGGCRNPDDAKAACHKLATHGYLKPEKLEHIGHGRNPGEHWKVNPVVLSDLSGGFK